MEIPADFNPRSHKGSDTNGSFIVGIINDFNPRSHKGSDQVVRFLSALEAISIHAPTRGATHTFSTSRHNINISIHAPTRGATVFYFSCIFFRYISIHAPTRGATNSVSLNLLSRFYFNPRSHKGSDSRAFRTVFSLFRFQSTLPQGERPCSALKCNLQHNFNPRSHKGSDDQIFCDIL